jgi:trimethylamine--corrinoid protein Co-methyltransferase
MRGIAVSDDRIAVDVIEAVGHDGSFLAEAHTVQNFRKELWFPKLLDRQYWSNWMGSGHSDMHARLIAEKDRLLSKHEPTPLDPALDHELARIVAAAEEDL